jgi:chorismate synthase
VSIGYDSKTKILYRSGFQGTEIPGSKHNDMFILNPLASNSIPTTHGFTKPKLTTSTNNSGGIQGGISNGAPIFFRVAFKPPATIGQAQKTVTYNGEDDGFLENKGRHQIVEAMASLCIMDALLMQGARKMATSALPPLNVSLSS